MKNYLEFISENKETKTVKFYILELKGPRNPKSSIIAQILSDNDEECDDPDDLESWEDYINYFKDEYYGEWNQQFVKGHILTVNEYNLLKGADKSMSVLHLSEEALDLIKGFNEKEYWMNKMKEIWKKYPDEFDEYNWPEEYLNDEVLMTSIKGIIKYNL